MILFYSKYLTDITFYNVESQLCNIVIPVDMANYYTVTSYEWPYFHQHKCAFNEFVQQNIYMENMKFLLKLTVSVS